MDIQIRAGLSLLQKINIHMLTFGPGSYRNVSRSIFNSSCESVSLPGAVSSGVMRDGCVHTLTLGQTSFSWSPPTRHLNLCHSQRSRCSSALLLCVCVRVTPVDSISFQAKPVIPPLRKDDCRCNVGEKSQYVPLSPAAVPSPQRAPGKPLNASSCQSVCRVCCRAARAHLTVHTCCLNATTCN